MTADDLELMRQVRESPRMWFEGFGYYLDDENNREPRNGPALVLQRRYFEHYRRCLADGTPCRIVGLKYRRASSSTGANAILYHHAQNFTSRLGVIGKDYKSSGNMLDMIKTFGEHDKFPGWYGAAFNEETELVEWEDRVEKMIATKVVWSNGSRVELYTANNPTAARSAGLQGYLGTEVGSWPKDGEKSGSKTLMAMRATLPKKGFHVCIEESTAEGAAGIFYDTCKAAHWPEYAKETWAKKWMSDWPLEEEATEAERTSQFVFIFAAWFEDERNFDRLNAADEKHVRDSIDKDAWHEGEQEMMDRYLEDGPRGKRLGTETDATVWEQLAWRRRLIKAIGGLENFKQEFPSNPLEAFRATGAPVFCQEGLTAIEVAQREVVTEWGQLDVQPSRPLWPVWRRTRESEAVFAQWEAPIVGCRYLLIVDPMSGKELVPGQRKRDCHSILVLRARFTDEKGRVHLTKEVARIKAPCRWEVTPLCRQIALLARFFGNCMVVVEQNIGTPVLTRLRDDYHLRLYVQEVWDSIAQTSRPVLGFLTDEEGRRMAVSAGQEYVREQKLDLPDAHTLSEMKTFVFNKNGHAEASGSNHDDDVLALCIGLCCINSASEYAAPEAVDTSPPDERDWR